MNRNYILMFAPWLIAMCVTACDSDDIGKACGTDGEPWPLNPVGGEVPIAERIRMERDGTCETFQCLRREGLDPHCTRSCDYVDTGKQPATCASDADCPTPETCANGMCRDDDCPAGFLCRQVQPVGPLSTEQYCVRKTACQKNLDCEAVGTNICVSRGCYDVCLRDGETCETSDDCAGTGSMECRTGQCRCVYHEFICEKEEALPCRCAGAGQAADLDCTDDELECGLTTQVDLWSTNSVSRVGVCEQKEGK